MTRRSILFAAAALALAAQARAQRLPAGVHPTHYTLALTPDLKAATFTGQETIDLTLDTPTPTVTLNSAEIEIQSVTAASQSAAISFDTAKEQATFTFPQPLSGTVTLNIRYTGILNNQLRGFYLSRTKLRNYAVTQFEPTDARRAFPSFDEPGLKSTFDIALTVDAADTVISNGPLLADRPAQPGKHTLTFATTPKMSTYLVAFLVGDFQCTTGKADGVPIRVCGTPDKIAYTGFALEAAEYILPFYNRYFGIRYPMPKLDLIGLPDFEAGAMENFGCITYRETDLFVDKDANIDARKSVASVVAHEMAHQWFGDMVTMQWWDNLWLNEGFATWMSAKPIAKWHPEWNFPEDVAATLNDTLNLDAQPTTHPIRARDTSTPAQINELFDGISYGKGGAVLGMVENFLGEETFRQGVHNYLQAHLYANATAEDFWNAQTATSHQPVDRIMAGFIDQPGVPLLTFSETTATTVNVNQGRFFLSPAPVIANDIAYQWTIPVCLKPSPHAARQTQKECRLLAPNQPQLQTDPRAPFFYANASGHGYYRTAYTPTELKAISASAESSLNPPERIGLLGDQYALARTGHTQIGEFMDMALALKSDPNAEVMETSFHELGIIPAESAGAHSSILADLATPEDRDSLHALIRREFSPIYVGLGRRTSREPYNRQKLRTLLFEALGEARDPAVLDQARAFTAAAFTQAPAPDPAMADAAINIAAETGDATLYDKLQAIAENATDPGLRTDALHTLARFQSPILVIRTLDYAGSGKVRNQDSHTLYTILLRQPETRDLAWSYIQQHWEKVSAQFTTNSGVRVVAATGNFCTEAQRAEVQTFFATHHVDAADRTLAKAVDSIDDCTRRRATQEPALHQWLAAHTQPVQ